MPGQVPLGRQRSSRDRPPRGESRPKAKPKPKPETEVAAPQSKKRTPADRKLAASIAGIYQMVGAGIAGLGLRMNDEGLVGSGAQTIEMAEPISEAWLDLADTNPKVRAALTRMTEVSSAGVLLGLHVTLAVPLLVHRGVIPEQFAVMFSDAQAAEHAEANGGTTS